MASLKQRALAAYEWLESRLGLIAPLSKAAAHPTPANNSSWWYVFGSAATVLLLLQVVTGILLALVYSPSANEAWASLGVLNHSIALGWYLRALHGWGSDFMIAIVLIHVVQVLPVRGVQIPARTDLDGRRRAAAADAGDGLHGAGDALRPRCVLGSRHRRLDHEPSTADWGASGAPVAGRPDHRRGRRFHASLRCMCLWCRGCC